MRCYPANASTRKLFKKNILARFLLLHKYRLLPCGNSSGKMACRNEVQDVLKSLLKVAKKLDTLEYCPADLKQLGIRFSIFSLANNSSPICTPWARKPFEEALKEIPNHRIPVQPKYVEAKVHDEAESYDSDDSDDEIFPYWKALGCESYLVDYFEVFCGAFCKLRP